LPVEPRPAVVEERRAPVVEEAQRTAVAVDARWEAEAQPAALVAAALSVTSAMEGHLVPTVVETRPEATAAEARSEAAVGTQQEPALAGSSRAVVVEIPDDDSPPPGWDQWVNLPMLSPESQEGVLVRRWDGHVVAGGRGHGAEASSSRVGRSAPGEGRVDEPPAFADAQEEQQLWGGLRDHGAALNWALNEALQIHGGPAWRVFQVKRCCPFSSISSSSCLFLAARRLLVLICWWQELEHRARDKYGALDQMSAELRHLQEQRDAFDALVDALGTPDSWLSYRAKALRDQLQECERQATTRPSTLERICTALIDRDEAM
jgi:hypothetical protein